MPRNSPARSAYINNAKTKRDTLHALADKEIVALFTEHFLMRDRRSIDLLAKQQPNTASFILAKLQWFMYNKLGIGQSNEVKSINPSFEKDIRKLEGMYVKALTRAGVNPLQDYAEFADRSGTEMHTGVTFDEYFADREGVRYQTDLKFYDYSKPFEQQIEDLDGELIPQDNALVMGGTPKVLQDIGLADLPLTINQEHVDYAVNGTNDYDHFIGKDMLLQIPNALSEPISVFTSGTHRNDSVVALVNLVHDGEHIVVPISISGISNSNNLRIDATAVKSVYAKDYSISNVLMKAVERELNGTFSLFYLDNKKASELLESNGVLIPQRFPMLNGIIHTITEPDSPVNVYPKNQTDTSQFKAWFRKSKVTSDGMNPSVVYNANPSVDKVFEDGTIPDAVGDLPVNGHAFYVSKENAVSAFGNDNARSYYLSIKKPAPSVFVKRLARIVDNEVRSGKPNAIREGARNASDEVRFRLIDKQFDGVHWTENGNDIWIAFKPNQVKSATDNIGLFSEHSNNTEYHTGITFEDSAIRYHLGDTIAFDDRYDPASDANAHYADPFCHKSLRVPDTMKGDKLAANGVAGALKSKGVKDGEPEWLGLDRWLEGKKSVAKYALFIHWIFVKPIAQRIPETFGSPCRKCNVIRNEKRARAKRTDKSAADML